MKPYLLLILCVAYLPGLQAQTDPVIQKAQSLVANVVRLEVKIEDGRTEKGFGFVTNESDGKLYLVTAAHVVHGDQFDLNHERISIYFSNSLERKIAREITWFEDEDLALLEVEKPAAYSWRYPFAASSFSNYDKVRFVGRNQRFNVLNGGEIIEIDGAQLFFTPSFILPGTSGAPLINASGIVGMITDDSVEGATALSIQEIRDLLQVPSGGSPYFAGAAPVRDSDPVSPTPEERTNFEEENDFIRISGGTYRMGDQFNEGSSNEKPVHKVTLSDFYISNHEVTFFEYDQYCADTNAKRPDDESWGRGNRPAINVSWYDAVNYCNWKSEQDNLQKVYRVNGTTVSADWSANGYRLPTEAEWEYAARNGGKQVRFGNGKDIADANEMNFDARSDYKENYSRVGDYKGKTMPYGSYQASPIGLYDMSGNVWEWCWDWYDADYYATSDGASNPKGASSGQSRVVRGGSWFNVPNYCRASYRNWINPSFRFNYLGFRLVRHAP